MVFILGTGYLYLGVLRLLWVRYAVSVLVNRNNPHLQVVETDIFLQSAKRAFGVQESKHHQ